MEKLEFLLNTLIKKIRVEYGYTQQEFALKLNCSVETISKMERNQREVADSTLISLSYFCGINLFHFKYYANNYKSFTEYNAYFDLYETLDYIIPTSVNDLEKRVNFLNLNLNFGEFLTLKNYANAYIQFYKYKNYYKAQKYCLLNIKNNISTTAPPPPRDFT